MNEFNIEGMNYYMVNKSKYEENPSQIAIRDYIENVHNSGALLVSGAWGSGKTYFLKSLADEYNNNGNKAIAIVSLFGLNSYEEIDEAVKKKVCCAFADVNDEKKIGNRVLNGIRIITDKFKDKHPVFDAVDTLININYLDFVELSPEILDKQIILIFDDFERCPLTLKNADLLLGIINDYCENIGIKTIIIANSKELEKNDTFKNYKEKVIYRTINLEQNTTFVLSQIIKSFKEEQSNYQRFLIDNIDLIRDVFERSTYNNYRSFKVAINEFSRIYYQFEDYTNYSDSNKFKDNEKAAILLMLEHFLALTFESCSGNEIYKDLYNFSPYIDLGQDENGEDQGEVFDPEDYPEYMMKYECGDYNFIPNAFIEYIEKGIYNMENIQSLFKECIDLKTPSSRKPYEIFLHSRLITIDDDIFTGAYKDALEKAYNGDLFTEEYLALLSQIYTAKQLKLSLPVPPNYKDIENGFDSIDRTNEEAPVFYLYGRKVCTEAKGLQKKITDYIENRPISKNIKEYYDYCFEYFKTINNSSNPQFRYSNNISIELDENLINEILKSFRTAKNENREKIANAFSNILFSNNKDKQLAERIIYKLEDMKKELDSKPIAIINVDYFIEKIKEKFLIQLPQ